MSCPVCGAQNEANAAFCYRCGSALKPADPAVGRTVNLGRADTPPFGTSAAQPREDTGARVYDLPSTSSVSPDPPSPAFRYASDERAASNLQPGSAVDAPASGVPQFSVPQLTRPEYGSSTVIMPPQSSSSSAQISMILGVVALTVFVVPLCTIVLSFLSPIALVFGIPALIVGQNARKEIRASGGQIGGEGMAKAGVIMGWISIGLSILAIVAICGIFVFAVQL